MTHWRAASGELLCGKTTGLGDDATVDEFSPADCPDCLDIMVVARRACEIVFTEACDHWTMREVRDQLFAEFGHARVERSRTALFVLIDD